MVFTFFLYLFCLEMFVFFEKNTNNKDCEGCREEDSHQTWEIVEMTAEEWEREVGNAIDQTGSDQEKPQHEVCNRVSIKQPECSQKPQRAESSHKRNGEEVTIEHVEVEQS